MIRFGEITKDSIAFGERMLNGMALGSRTLWERIVEEPGPTTRQYASFDGVNDYLQLPTITEDLSNAFTIEMYANVKTGTTQYGDLFSLNNVSNTGAIRLQINQNSGESYAVQFNYTKEDGTNLGHNISAYIIPDSWHHYAISFSYDGGSSMTIKSYRDGVLIDTGLKYSSYLKVTNRDWCLIAARATDNPATRFSAIDIDNFRIWNVERTSSQISENMDTELTPQTGLIRQYLLNGNANDSSGNNFHGTTYNGVTFN